MKLEWLIANVTSVWSPDRVNHDILGMILSVFWSILAGIAVGDPFWDVRFPSWALIPLLNVFY